MTDVPVRELNQDTAGVLARVKAGEHVSVTERGRAIAHLTPAVPTPLADLVAHGHVTPPSLVGPPPRPTGPVRSEDPAGELLESLRDDERV